MLVCGFLLSVLQKTGKNLASKYGGLTPTPPPPPQQDALIFPLRILVALKKEIPLQKIISFRISGYETCQCDRTSKQYYRKKLQVNFTLKQAVKTARGSRGIAVSFL